MTRFSDPRSRISWRSGAAANFDAKRISAPLTEWLRGSTGGETPRWTVEAELPKWLGVMHERFKSPQRVILALGIVGIVLVNVFPLRQLMPVASACTLIWYAATHYASLLLPREKRFASPVISWIGLAACAGLFLSLPSWSIVGSAFFLIFLAGMRWALLKSQARYRT